MRNNYIYPFLTWRGFLCRVAGTILLITSPVSMPIFIIFDNRSEIEKYFRDCLDLMRGDVNS